MAGLLKFAFTRSVTKKENNSENKTSSHNTSCSGKYYYFMEI